MGRESLGMDYRIQAGRAMKDLLTPKQRETVEQVRNDLEISILQNNNWKSMSMFNCEKLLAIIDDIQKARRKYTVEELRAWFGAEFPAVRGWPSGTAPLREPDGKFSTPTIEAVFEWITRTARFLGALREGE